MTKTKFAFFTGWALLMSCVASQAQQATAGENPRDVLAAQIRLQGFACDQALKATRDAKRSRPDREVWVLRCSNAIYRVSRAPDMVASVERLR